MIPMDLAKRRPAEAFRPANLFDAGIGNVIITRFKANGRAESGVYYHYVLPVDVADEITDAPWFDPPGGAGPRSGT